MSSAAVEAVGGAVGSCIAYGITYPLTTISTWQALERTKQATQETTPGLRLLPTPLADLIKVAQTSGTGALFAGIQPFLVATALSQGLYFYAYAAIRNVVVAAQSKANAGSGNKLQAGAGRSHDIGVAGSLVVASLAGAVNAAVSHPLWLIALRQQAALRKGRDTPEAKQTAWQAVRQVYTQDGVLGFWKGLVPALIMVINPTINYILYEWLTARLLGWRRRQAAARSSGRAAAPATGLSAGDAFLLSALAKLGATLTTYPMLVVKSRMQAGASGGASREDQYRAGVVDAVRRIVRQEGWRGLFKGMQAKLLQTVLGAALLMAIKEQVYTSIRALQAQARAAAATRARAALVGAVRS